VDDGSVGAGGDDHEVAVPRGEILERGKQFLLLRSELDALDALLGLSRRQVEPVDDLQLGHAGCLAPRTCGGDDDAGRRGGVELRIEVRLAGDSQELRPALASLGVEQPRGAVEPAPCDPRDDCRLVAS